MTARPFTPDMGRPPKSRQVPGWIHALVLFLVLVGSAWTGAHGPMATAVLVGRVVLFALGLWVCAVVLAVGVLVLVAIVLVLLDTAGGVQ